MRWDHGGVCWAHLRFRNNDEAARPCLPQLAALRPSPLRPAVRSSPDSTGMGSAAKAKPARLFLGARFAVWLLQGQGPAFSQRLQMMAGGALGRIWWQWPGTAGAVAMTLDGPWGGERSRQRGVKNRESFSGANDSGQHSHRSGSYCNSIAL